MTITILVALSVLLQLTTAQILPSSYIHATFQRSKDQIIDLTDGSFDALLATYKGRGWTAQNFWTTVALWDQTTGRTSYKAKLDAAQSDLFANPGGGNDIWKVPGVNYYNDDNGWAGLAALQAYEVYGDAKYLTWAKDIFKFTEGHGLVTEQVISDGYIKGTKNPDNKVGAECNGKTNVGAVYWVNGGNPASDSLNAAAHDSLNAVSTGNHALLGAELCRVTGDMSYCDKALTSIEWVTNHLVSPDGFVYDNLKAKDCAVTKWVFTYNQGLYFAVYAQIGKLTNNAKATEIAVDAMKAALSPSAPWNNDKGIIKEAAGDVEKSDDGIGFKSIMIRYLRPAAALVGDEELSTAVKEYINIQYYALTQLDSDSQTKPVRYGRNWEGPYTMSSDHAQVAAMDVLVAAVAINPDSAFSASGTGGVMALGDRAADSEPAPAPEPSSNAIPKPTPEPSRSPSPTAEPGDPKPSSTRLTTSFAGRRPPRSSDAAVAVASNAPVLLAPGASRPTESGQGGKQCTGRKKKRMVREKYM